MTEDAPESPATAYDLFGGAAFFESLVAAFYSRVGRDPVLRPMYPEEDLAGAQRRLTLFLGQYWGGPGTYSEERGHPRLRMRHAGFAIDSVARDRWLTLMHDAVVEQGLPEDSERLLWQYLVGAAFAMQNIADDAPPAHAIDVTEA
ncbi:MAG: globin [Actinomycetota bacterium]|nr:globin [Actinomycetota bacterium]